MTARCKVAMLRLAFTAQDLMGDANELLLKTISRCNCPEHASQMPVELPTFAELHRQLVNNVSELLDWGLDNMGKDNTGDIRNLVTFIDKYCLDTKSESLFVMLDRLQEKYSQ
jgi:hypothetical protein